MDSADSIRAETITVAAKSVSEPLPKKRSRRWANAAPVGVPGAGLVPDRTGVKPPGARLATVAPSTAETSVLKAAPRVIACHLGVNGHPLADSNRNYLAKSLVGRSRVALAQHRSSNLTLTIENTDSTLEWRW